MSDNPNLGFAKFVPGFDFLQSLAKGATQTIPQLPNLSNWVAPTLNVEELEKRIEELKAVHFWLDQNSKALSATIQALEVQKMTLATLKGMNFNMGDLANAMKLKAGETMMGGMQKAAETAASAAKKVSSTSRGSGAKAKAAGSGVVDPMQWWGSLTQQFQQIAADAMKDAARNTAIDTARNMATGVAKEAVKSVTRKTPAKKARKTTGRKTG
ncbi:PhaM family polyhydroxyalkanoate granule multifunctional regulatory protein [Ramlibacter humi]|uniref:PhaM family polyhydroxyalkanoate granule multifunctional regulatory protein n=1 Tax=Ramlibacter humi TaxID=2530451 RepID=UPI00308442C3